MSDDFDLVATLRDALQFATGHVQGAANALELLSDRSALLWALLEEEAGEVVEVQKSPWVTMISHGRASIRLQDNREGQREDTVNIRVHEARFIPDLILCLARAIQEQRKREAGVQDA